VRSKAESEKQSRGWKPEEPWKFRTCDGEAADRAERNIPGDGGFHPRRPVLIKNGKPKAAG